MREVNITKWKGIKIKQNNYYGTKEVGSSQIRRGPEEESKMHIYREGWDHQARGKENTVNVTTKQ